MLGVLDPSPLESVARLYCMVAKLDDTPEKLDSSEGIPNHLDRHQERTEEKSECSWEMPECNPEIPMARVALNVDQHIPNSATQQDSKMVKKVGTQERTDYS